MPKQKKYTNQLDIEADIIKQKRMAVNERRLAERHHTEMRRWYDLANSPELTSGKQEYYRGKGGEEKRLMTRNLTRARRIEELKLPALGRALAAFKTTPFAFMDNDRSVVLQ